MKSKSLPHRNLIPFTSAIVAMFALQTVHAQTIEWINATTATAWYTGANWSPNTASGAWATSNVAQFNNTGTATTAGINMNTASLSIGAIEVTSTRTRALSIGNSSATAGTLTLNGATVNSVNNVILRNASGSLLTLRDNDTGSGKTMNVALANATNNIILIEGSGGVTISSSISGTGRQLSRQGTGTGSLTLSGNNTFDGGINYSGLGILALQHSNAAGAGTISLASTQTGTTATFSVSGDINVANDIIMDAATGRNTINSTSGNNTLSGDITINNTSSNIVTFMNQGAVGTTYTVGGATSNSTTITAATYSNTISFRATNDGALGVLNSRITAPNATFNINNSGFWTVNSTGNTWAATTLSTATSRIKLGATDALATGARIDFASGASGYVDLNGFNQTVAGLVGANSGSQIRNDSATADSILTLAGLSTNRSFNGAITDGTGGKKTSLVMDSSGRVQTLSGTNTYTGTTLVSAGTLLVNGSLGNTAVTVDPMATVGGTGSLGGSLTFAASSFLQVADINDPLAVGGTTTFGSGFGIANLLGIDWDALDLNTPYTILSSSQDFSLAGLDNFGLANAANVGLSDRQAYFINGSLAIVVIPEPHAALLGGLGLLALLRRRRSESGVSVFGNRVLK
jgi:autotransporter-associated beta strand protein